MEIKLWHQERNIDKSTRKQYENEMTKMRIQENKECNNSALKMNDKSALSAA